MQIALFERDAEQASLIASVLALGGHACRSYDITDDIADRLQDDGIAMLIVHRPMSDRDADVLLRQARCRLPVLFIAATGAEDDIVAALAAGASDYIIKPLRQRELATRVDALLKRFYPQRHAEQPMRFGRHQFEPRSGRAAIDGCPVPLTRKEFALALLLFRHLGQPLSRAYIEESVWPGIETLSSRTLDTHVSKIRGKLALQPECGFRLAPVYGYGYRLERLGE